MKHLEHPHRHHAHPTCPITKNHSSRMVQNRRFRQGRGSGLGGSCSACGPAWVPCSVFRRHWCRLGARAPTPTSAPPPPPSSWGSDSAAGAPPSAAPPPSAASPPRQVLPPRPSGPPAASRIPSPTSSRCCLGCRRRLLRLLVRCVLPLQGLQQGAPAAPTDPPAAPPPTSSMPPPPLADPAASPRSPCSPLRRRRWTSSRGAASSSAAAGAVGLSS